MLHRSPDKPGAFTKSYSPQRRSRIPLGRREFWLVGILLGMGWAGTVFRIRHAVHQGHKLGSIFVPRHGIHSAVDVLTCSVVGVMPSPHTQRKGHLHGVRPAVQLAFAATSYWLGVESYLNATYYTLNYTSVFGRAFNGAFILALL